MPREERDDITLWVANDEGMHNAVMRLYDQWVSDFEGGYFDEVRAERKMADLVEDFAEQLFWMGFWEKPYTAKEKREAIDELMGDFEQYRDDEIAERKKNEEAKPVPRKPMDEGDEEYARKIDKQLVQFGLRLLPDIFDHPVNMTEEDSRRAAVDYLLRFMPATKQKIRHALETGDEHLNTIKLRLWDEKAEEMNWKRFSSARNPLSLSDALGLLKHVAKFYYA